VQELNKQGEQADRSYKEPRCHEGNLGLLGILANMRAADKAFAEGRGPDPATEDNASNLNLGEELRPVALTYRFVMARPARPTLNHSVRASAPVVR